ncbi:hypothetical protein PMPD1_1737 [Paramixta manurensis]|uniref:Dit-like phage tail protein N-terminal domain-containing protein n=1 Tax=Paramixta manurensis TaxID=2740817 RepID=A0A6M8UDV6_9GAMM|nr:hypothetical protein PMPD1_1737 [Erwiniaceae bacterium PD-1]
MSFSDLLGFTWNGGLDNLFHVSNEVIGSLEFDSIDSETHDWQRDITQNPVENGIPIADHIIEKPRSLTVTGMISNSPITEAEIFSSQFNSVNIEERVAKALATLDDLYHAKILVTIYTRYMIYKDMVITSINIPRTPDIGDAIVFTLQATQLRIVSAQSTQLPKGLGVKKVTDSEGKAGTSNSNDIATRKRAGGMKNNGKASSDKGPIKDGSESKKDFR